MASLQTFDPNTAGNFEEIEMQFAVKTVEFLETYQKLITSIPPNSFKLTALDDDIFADFKESFPELDNDESLTKLDEGELKSVKGKDKWRKFIMKYEKTVPDYNFGTLLRQDASREYEQDNSILVTRVQFYAIEIARNRRGLNDALYAAAQEEKKAAKAAKAGKV